MQQITGLLKTTTGKIVVFGGGLVGLVLICFLCAICSTFIRQNDEQVAKMPSVQTPLPTTTNPPTNTPEPPTPTPVPSTSVPPTPIPPTQSVMSIIPEDVTYSIINEEIVPEIKRSLDVRINKKVSEDVLRSIAMELKNSDPNTYERIFIVYYLPEMEVGAGGWATTHFNPNLEIQIQDTLFPSPTSVPTPDQTSVKIIGTWFDDIYNVEVSIFMEGNKFYIHDGYEDIELTSSDGQTFYKADSDAEYFVINPDGDLEFWDVAGYVYTAKKKN